MLICDILRRSSSVVMHSIHNPQCICFFHFDFSDFFSPFSCPVVVLFHPLGCFFWRWPLSITISDYVQPFGTDNNVRNAVYTHTECPPATDGMERFACPTPDRQGRYRCIDDHVLCDGFIDCPEGADEDRQACMFYKTVS